MGQPLGRVHGLKKRAPESWQNADRTNQDAGDITAELEAPTLTANGPDTRDKTAATRNRRSTPFTTSTNGATTHNRAKTVLLFDSAFANRWCVKHECRTFSG